MALIAFDTLKSARELEKSGFNRGQAEAWAEQLAEARSIDLSQFATRDDLHHELTKLRTEVKADIADLRAEMKSDIAELRTEVKSEIAELRNELRTEVGALRSELRAETAERRSEMRLLEHRMVIKLGAMIVVMTGTIIAAFRYMMVMGH